MPTPAPKVDTKPLSAEEQLDLLTKLVKTKDEEIAKLVKKFDDFEDETDKKYAGLMEEYKQAVKAKDEEIELLYDQGADSIHCPGYFALPATEFTHSEMNPDSKHHETGSQFYSTDGQWAYVEKCSLTNEDTYRPQSMFRRALKAIERAFSARGDGSIGAGRFGAITKSGGPDCTTLPPFNNGHKVCVAVWLEEAK